MNFESHLQFTFSIGKTQPLSILTAFPAKGGLENTKNPLDPNFLSIKTFEWI
jgi:hypothetical protein